MIRFFFHPVLSLVCRDRRLRSIGLTFVYATVFTATIWTAYQLRFDFEVPLSIRTNLLEICAFAVGVKLLCMFAFHQFDGLLTYFSTPDLKRLVHACLCGSLVLGAFWLMVGIELAPPRSVILTDFLLCLISLCATRLGFQRIRGSVFRAPRHVATQRRNVGIVGAGDSGAALARELLSKPWLGLQPVAFFDDFHDTRCTVHGIPVVGCPKRIVDCKEKLRLAEIIIAMPSASSKRMTEVLRLIQLAGLPCRSVPSLDQLATGRVSVTTLRPLQIEDLLGRVAVKIEGETVRDLIKGRVVMVTGAGGSIGSELCRQVACFEPATLLLVERAEPQLFAIEQELRALPSNTVAISLVGDIAHHRRMREIFRQVRPDLIFHAAAHKHVPMMEAQPEEAIRNNILGTAQLAELAILHAVERFIFISTDKAVNPTSVMGATKRFAEIYLQSLHTRLHQTKFMAVRFGNVLGSSGSVVPTFTRQIAAGGPVTVTHPEMTRFFMTIPEAVSLVLQSSAYGKGGDIFVLDMGKPVKIVELARQMISLSGLKAGEDIEIVFTGLRPGEKLHEELNHRRENLVPTAHPKITRLLCTPTHFAFIRAFLEAFAAGVNEDDLSPEELKALLGKAIPEYTPFPLESDPLPIRTSSARSGGSVLSAKLTVGSV